MTEDEKHEKISQFHKSEEIADEDFSNDPWNADAIREVANKILERMMTR